MRKRRASRTRRRRACSRKCSDRALLALRPHPRGLAFLEEFHVNHVGIAAHGAVLDVALLPPGAHIQRHDDFLAAGWAGIRSLIGSAAATYFAALLCHDQAILPAASPSAISRIATGSHAGSIRRVSRSHAISSQIPPNLNGG